MFRGQSTIELLILFAGGMLALVVVAAVLPAQAVGSQTLRDGQIARDTVNDISSGADEVYLTGDGAQKSIWITLPETTKSSNSFIGARASETNWSKKKMVLLNTTNEGDIFAISNAPMCGSWPSAAGRYKINLTYNESPVAHVMVNTRGC